MISTRSYTAALTVDEGYPTTPGYDIPHAATNIYSQDFEAGVDGWTGDANTTVSAAGIPGGFRYLFLQRASGTTSLVATRVFTGLTIGLSYTISGQVLGNALSGTQTATVGVSGIGTSSPVNPATGGSPVTATLTFTATATSHTAVLTNTQSLSASYAIGWDNVVVTQNAWTEHVPPVLSYSLPLTVLDGTAKLDEGWAPYGQVDLTVAYPDPDPLIEVVNPDKYTCRVVLHTIETVEGVTSDHSYDLSLRERKLNHNDKTITLTLATDEALLQDYTYVATSTDKSALQYQGSLRALINAKILAPIGAALESPSKITHTNLVGDPNTTTTARWSWPTPAVTSVAIVGGQLRMIANGTATSYFYPTVQAGVPTVAGRYAISAGTRYTIRCEVTNSGTQAIWVALGASFYTSTGGGSGVTQVPGRTALAVGQTLTMEYTNVAANGSSTTTGLLPLLYMYGSAAGGIPLSGMQYDTTRWQLEIGDTAPASSPYPFFSGGSPVNGDLKYSWMGTANASPSIETYTDPSMQDADFTTLTGVTNIITNPSAEVNATDWTQGGGCTIARVTTQHYQGVASIAATATTTSFAVFATNTTTYLPASAGTSYTGSIWALPNAAGMSATVTVRYLDASNVTLLNATGTVTALPTTGWTRVRSATSVAPVNTARVAVYVSVTGTAAGRITYLDNAMLTEGDGLDTGGQPYDYFDGDTADNAFYNYQWSAVASASSSSRTPVFSRDPQALWLEPGENLYDFIWPVLDTMGLRLFCDEKRDWRLVTPAYSIVQRVTLATDTVDNVYTATDTISKTGTGDDGALLSYQAVIVKYTWNDTKNVAQTAYDTAGPSGVVTRVVEWNRPYMGPGMASYILSQAAGKGRTLDITARRDFSVRPGMETSATLPNTPIQTGRVASVEWNFGSDDMTVGTKGLTDTPANAWALAPAGRTWATAPGTWDTYTN